MCWVNKRMQDHRLALEMNFLISYLGAILFPPSMLLLTYCCYCDRENNQLNDCGSTNLSRLGKVCWYPMCVCDTRGYARWRRHNDWYCNLKAKYIKLDKPQSDKNDEDSVSDAGSEPLLNSAPTDQCIDWDKLELTTSIDPSTQAQTHKAGDSNHGSHICSYLNDSSLLEGNKQKSSSSKLLRFKWYHTFSV